MTLAVSGKKRMEPASSLWLLVRQQTYLQTRLLMPQPKKKKSPGRKVDCISHNHKNCLERLKVSELANFHMNVAF